MSNLGTSGTNTTSSPEIIRIDAPGDGVLLWIGAKSEESAREYVSSLRLHVKRSKWAGKGHYRSDVYIVHATSSVPTQLDRIFRGV